MAFCLKCGQETESLVNGTLMCASCDSANAPVERTAAEVQAARDNLNLVRIEYDQQFQKLLSLPAAHAEGTLLLESQNELLRDAGNRLSKALAEYREALDHEKNS
jgi:hypothetical protein